MSHSLISTRLSETTEISKRKLTELKIGHSTVSWVAFGKITEMMSKFTMR